MIGFMICHLLYNYYISHYETHDNAVGVSSNHLIENVELKSDYYPVYKDVIVDWNGISLRINHINFRSQDIVKGRDVKNEYEVVLSKKYLPLLNSNIDLVLNAKHYYFKVVGIHDDVLNEEFGQVTSDMLLSLHKSSRDITDYRYVFIVDDYDELNSNIDILKKNGYDLNIIDNEGFGVISSYNTIIAIFTLVSSILLSFLFINIVF